MAVYTDPAQAKEVFDALWQGILAVESSNEQFAAAGVVLGVYYTDPAYFVAIDGTASPAVLVSDPDTKVDIEVRMSADTSASRRSPNTRWCRPGRRCRSARTSP